MNGQRIAVGAGVGAVLGAVWWGIWELISSGAVCSKDDWQCLGVGLVAIPVGMVVGGVVAWAVMRALGFDKPVLAAVVGILLTAFLMLLTIWAPVPAGQVIAAAIGFAIAAAVTQSRSVSQTAARD
jgi:cation transporter-like permease